ncbi:hypothetical protein [Lentibacillus sediminis]|uniref:hypothetical protein n=1 Tax=Lentibacillus sediminis TaxID=1940529 RepID=UPI00130439E3|nr:hypothetical protein [Lentibacillus sediminis]
MEIQLQGLTGEIYEAKQKDNNTFVVSIEGEEYNSDLNKLYNSFSEDQKNG